MFMSSLGVAKNPLSSSNNELFIWWLGPAASHSLGLPFTRGFQAQQGIFKIRVFQKELVFHDGEVYISGTTELSVEAPNLATLFFFFQSEYTPALQLLIFLQGWWCSALHWKLLLASLSGQLHLPWMPLVVQIRGACVHSARQHPGTRTAFPRLLAHLAVLPQRVGHWQAAPAAFH